MTLDERLAEAARHLADRVTPPEVDLGVVRAQAITNRRRRRAGVAAATVLVVGVVGGIVLQSDQGDGVPSPAHREHREPDPAPRTDGVVSAAVRGNTSTRSSKVEPPMTLPLDAEMLKDPHTEPLPAWWAFDQETGGFLWTDEPENPDLFYTGSRTLVVRSPGRDTELAQISCTGGCSEVLSFGPAPDEVTVLVTDLAKDPVNPGPESIARVYGLDGSLRDEIDLAQVMGTDRHVLEETGDWADPDGTEALVADIEWAPDGTRLAVSTYPGFFEADCPPAALPCEALVWSFDRDGGDPVLFHRQPSYVQDEDVWKAPILTELAWTSDSSRLGMVLLSDDQRGSMPPPSLVRLDVESGSASTLHEFSQCENYCRPVLHGFAWSPDGTHVAVTSGEGISVLDSDGTVVSDSADGGPGPLAWLVGPR